MPSSNTAQDCVFCHPQGDIIEYEDAERLAQWLYKCGEQNASLAISVAVEDARLFVNEQLSADELARGIADKGAYFVCLSGPSNFAETIQIMREKLQGAMGGRPANSVNAHSLFDKYSKWTRAGSRVAHGKSAQPRIESNLPDRRVFHAAEEFLAANHGFYDGLRPNQVFGDIYRVLLRKHEE